jgi:protein AroM
LSSLGVITIGQSPRQDMVPEMERWLPPVTILERGALDGLGAESIAELSPQEGDESLTTLLKDGSSVVIGRARILGLIQHHIDELETAGVDATLVVCTGEFPRFTHAKPLLMAERLLRFGAAALAGDGRVGVVCPLPEQKADSQSKFALLGNVDVTAATPYTEGTKLLEAAAHELAARGAEVLILDCMGYTEHHRAQASQASGLPVILSRAIVARLTAELIQG